LIAGDSLMRADLKHWLAGWIPPHFRRALGGGSANGAVRYSGSFASWDEARRHSDGYDVPAIVERVKQAQLKVARGEAACERDSVLFDKIEHSYPLVVGLLRAALTNGGNLRVVDIGGALGSTYYQCRALLTGVSTLRWNVVEQPTFVDCGRQHFESDELRFFPDVRSCLASAPVDVALLSGVLPYVTDPHAMLREVAEARLGHVMLDRTPLWERADRLTVQSVPPSIYGFAVSYPAWILNRQGVLGHFLPAYRLVDEFGALAGTIHVDGLVARDTGFLLERADTT
jgi:putative methyltransferase (TIGR04325 family)